MAWVVVQVKDSTIDEDTDVFYVGQESGSVPEIVASVRCGDFTTATTVRDALNGGV